MAHLFYATPCGGFPRMPYVVSMRTMLTAQTKWKSRMSDYAMRTGPVQMARSALCVDFVRGQSECTNPSCPGRWGADLDAEGRCPVCAKPGERWNYDAMVQHDDDLDVCPIADNAPVLDTWHDLLEDRPDVGMIGAIYMREAPMVPTMVVKEPGHEWNNMVTLCGWPRKPFEVDGIGTGFFIVRREVVEKLIDRDDGDVFRFVSTRNKLGIMESVGEDYDFCFRVRELGFKVVADPRVMTKHCKTSGRLLYEWKDWHDKCQDKQNPMRLDLGPEAVGSVLQQVERQTLDGIKFSMVCLNTRPVKERMARGQVGQAKEGLTNVGR